MTDPNEGHAENCACLRPGDAMCNCHKLYGPPPVTYEESSQAGGRCTGKNCTSDGKTPHSSECRFEYAANLASGIASVTLPMNRPADSLELLPCPFCGGDAYLSDYECGKDGMPLNFRNPKCRQCGVDLGYSTIESAIAGWNRRAALTPQPPAAVGVVSRRLAEAADYEASDSEFAKGKAAGIRAVLSDFATPTPAAVPDAVRGLDRTLKQMGWMRFNDGRAEFSVAPDCPPNRSGGLASPWFAIHAYEITPNV